MVIMWKDGLDKWKDGFPDVGAEELEEQGWLPKGFSLGDNVLSLF